MKIMSIKQKKELYQVLVEKMGGRFSRQIGINLDSGDSEEIFKWFLASILFGARISEGIAVKTYEEFIKEGLDSPQCLLDAGWDRLVQVLDAGGYVRYDFKTASKLLLIMEALVKRYKGDLNVLHQEARDQKDLEQKIISLGKGIGRVTANIFLRELRGVWSKAEPQAQGLAVMAAKRLGLIGEKDETELMNKLMDFFQRDHIKERRLADLESSLVRLAKDYCRKTLCHRCPLSQYCSYYKLNIK